MPPGTISDRMIGLLPFFSKVQNDTRAWLGTTYEHVSGSGSLQRLRVTNNRSANQTGHAGMANPGSARPSHWNVARFRQFEQTRKLTIPRDGNPAARK